MIHQYSSLIHHRWSAALNRVSTFHWQTKHESIALVNSERAFRLVNKGIEPVNATTAHTADLQWEVYFSIEVRWRFARKTARLVSVRGLQGLKAFRGSRTRTCSTEKKPSRSSINTCNCSLTFFLTHRRRPRDDMELRPLESKRPRFLFLRTLHRACPRVPRQVSTNTFNYDESRVRIVLNSSSIRELRHLVERSRKLISNLSRKVGKSMSRKISTESVLPLVERAQSVYGKVAS